MRPSNNLENKTPSGIYWSGWIKVSYDLFNFNLVNFKKNLKTYFM